MPCPMHAKEEINYSLGHQVVKNSFVKCFLKVPMLALAAQQLRYSPTACGIMRKHFTKHFSQPDALDCKSYTLILSNLL